MSGTSFDGVDVARLKTDGEDDVILCETFFVPYSDSLRTKLKTAASQSFRDILLLEKELSEIYLNAIKQFLHKYDIDKNDIDFAVIHGQTIFHEPQSGITSQLCNPHIIRENLGIEVMCDVRRSDMARGGLGAPIVPIFHKALAGMAKTELPCVYLNIGGVANISYIDATDELIAFDVGTGGAYIDDAMRKFFGRNYDNMGEVGRKGIAIEPLIEKFLSDEFFRKNTYPKSLDRESFAKYYDDIIKLPASDSVRTFTEITARGIAKGIRVLPEKPKCIMVGGGGRKNQFLLELIAEYTDIRVINTDDFNIDGDFIEAWAMAYIGARIKKKLPYTFRYTTGAEA
ncbi:MAG: hypothetical protein BGO27_02730 [Alphaproteobacteria bacterium 33-17]|nr:MAG: hypothetical protein BGO27_02730 [Alphaproteobacteria bacterium 33-17]